MKAELFRKKVALVTFQKGDSFSDGYAVVENPVIRQFAGQSFIEGVHSTGSAGYIRGRRVLIPLANIATITEFDSEHEIYGKRRQAVFSSKKPRIAS